MTPEEYERFKEAEKEHLRKLKKLKEAARVFERQKKIAGAVAGMSTSMQEKFDEHREMVDRLGMDAAMTEARMEVAMDSTSDRAQQINQASDDEDVLRKERARQLIREMQQEAASAPDREDAATRTSASDAKHSSGERGSETRSSSAGGTGSSQDPAQKKGTDLPEKTIGRMKP